MNLEIRPSSKNVPYWRGKVFGIHKDRHGVLDGKDFVELAILEYLNDKLGVGIQFIQEDPKLAKIKVYGPEENFLPVCLPLLELSRSVFRNIKTTNVTVKQVKNFCIISFSKIPEEYYAPLKPRW